MSAHSLPDVPPRYPEALQALRRGDLGTADAVCRALIAEQPAFVPGWLTASRVRLQGGDPEGALILVDRALALAPGHPRALVQHAHCLLALGRHAQADAAIAEAEQLAGTDLEVYDAIGTLHSLQGRQPQALAAYERALALAPDDPRFLFNRATVRRFLGDLAGAEADYDRVIALTPEDYEAHKNRSDLRRQSPNRNHVDSLRGLLARGIRSWPGEVQLRHALAKEYEDLGRYTEAWAELERGAGLRRRHLDYDVGVELQTVDWIIEAFPGAPAAGGGYPSSEPIFIVGLPRSGTTLVDRILSSHPAVTSAGERNDLAQVIVEGVRAAAGQGRVPRRELVARSATLDAAALGRAYVERARPAGAWTRHFIDKMPLNYLYVGLIRAALPNARVIHLQRHPLAVCYAMYKTLFKDGYPFSYDLDDIARYYLGYRRLMDHWRATLPGFVYEQSYEALVQGQRAATAGLLEFCGLEWDEACLEFHRNPAATTTASAAQVREPIYARSLAQWQHYAPQLASLRQRLLAGGIAASELDAG